MKGRKELERSLKKKTHYSEVILKPELALKITLDIGILTTEKSNDRHIIKMER